MTKLDHHHVGAHTNRMKKGKKIESKSEEENEGDEWVDEDEEDHPQVESVVFDLSALKKQIDRLVAQQGLPVTSGVPPVGGEEKINLINSIRPAIVVINQYRPVAIGEEERVSTTATGFIVDKERGILLTNRHVRHIGPCKSEAVLYDKSIVALEPIYVDPLHDFGFFKFQPRDDLMEIELAPQEAIPGSEIFVVGNNSAESLMILPSVLARVDRECPQYDMNTFYCTGANNTSGGSSGSPVLNRAGKAVALNSGGKVDTAVSYFFPLDGVVFALKKIQSNEHIPRGDLYTSWKHVSFDEAQRLGLPLRYIAEMKSTGTNKYNGVLVADNVLRDCKELFPGKNKRIQVGDILLKVNHHFVSDHWSLETLMGHHVDEEITLEVFRANAAHSLKCKVNNLDFANPTKIFVYNASSFHEVTYNTAMDNNILRRKRVFIAEAGSMFAFSTMSKGLIVLSVNNIEVNDLDHFMELIKGLTLNNNSGKAKICSIGPDEFETNVYDVVHFDPKYYGPPILWKRDINTCDWTYEDCPGYEVVQIVAPSTTTSPTTGIKKSITPAITINFAKSGFGAAIQSIFTDTSFREFSCSVEYSQPVWLRANPTKVIQQMLGVGDGKPEFFVGVGIVLDHRLGYVLVSRSVAPDTFGDVRIRFNGCEEIFAKTVFVHPVFNFSVVQYNAKDPKLSDITIRSATFLKDSIHTVFSGKSGVFYSMAEDGSIALPASPASVSSTCLTGGEVEMQYFPAKGTDMYTVGEKASGFFTDNSGTVLGISDSFYSACEFTDCLADFVQKDTGKFVKSVNVCPVKLMYKPLDEMISFGVPKQFIDRVDHFFSQGHFKDDTPVYIAVQRSTFLLKKLIDSGDMILELDHKPVFRVNDIHAAAARGGPLQLKIFRMKSSTVEDITLTPRVVPTVNFTHFITWCGINIRNIDDHDFDEFVYIHDADDEEEIPFDGSCSDKTECGGLLINGTISGTPAEIFGIPPYAVLLAINNVRVKTFVDFFRVINGIKDNESVTLKLLDPSGQNSVIYFVTDYKNTTTLNRWFDEESSDWKTVVFHHNR